MQLKKGVKRGEQTWVASLKIVEFVESSLIPIEVKRVLKKFSNGMPEELPKKLPPRRGVDHDIELVLDVKLSACAPYHMAILELQKLRRQLKGLLYAVFIQPSKAPYGDLVLF